MGIWLHDELRRRAFFSAGRRMGTVRAMALLARELDQIDLLAETPARRPDPPFVVIDEVSLLHSSAVFPSNSVVRKIRITDSSPGPTPRFAQLSCLQRQRSR